jgi:hypothetical protein
MTGENFLRHWCGVVACPSSLVNRPRYVDHRPTRAPGRVKGRTTPCPALHFLSRPYQNSPRMCILDTKAAACGVRAAAVQPRGGLNPGAQRHTCTRTAIAVGGRQPSQRVGSRSVTFASIEHWWSERCAAPSRHQCRCHVSSLCVALCICHLAESGAITAD